MNRFPASNAPLEISEGDTFFEGVNMRLAPELLERGLCSDARNITFRAGAAATRGGIKTPPAHNVFAVDGAEAGWVMFFCIDASSGYDLRCQQAMDIIDAYSGETGDARLRGAGFCSFGNYVDYTVPITADLNGIKAKLQLAIDNPLDPPFFGTAYSGNAMNGVDALAAAVDQIAQSAFAQRVNQRFVYLHSACERYAGQAADPATVNALLETVNGTWMNLESRGGIDGDDYADTFLERAAVIYPELNVFEPEFVDVPPRFLMFLDTALLGSGVYSDPLGREWMLLASPLGIHAQRDGHTPRYIGVDAADWDDTARVIFVQAFNAVLIFRTKADGKAMSPMEWDGTRTGLFAPVVAETDTESGSAATIPNGPERRGLRPVVMSNRLIVPHDRDELAVSLLLDYTHYDALLDAFRVNTGSDDLVTGIVPFARSSLLVFKDQSILLLANVMGDLADVALETVNRELGCVAGDTAALLGGDVLFLSSGGVYRISQAVQDRYQTAPVPVSDPIEPLMKRIHWPKADGAQAVVVGDYYWLAVPLDGADYNNALLPFNARTQKWEGLHTFPADVRLDALLVTDWNGVKRLYAVDHSHARVHLMDEGSSDHLGLDNAEGQAEGEVAIATSLSTRGYRMDQPDTIKQFRRVEVALQTRAPSFSIALGVDGVNELVTLASNVTRSRTKSLLLGRKPKADNVDGLHGQPYREDYTLAMDTGFYLGADGVAPDLAQTSVERHTARARGRAATITIANSAGHVAVREAAVAGFGTDRGTRQQI